MSNQQYTYEALCHCGAIGYLYNASQAAEFWSIRSCQCGFCRAHGARTTADSSGSVTFQLANPAYLQRYQFGTKSTDFLVCANCGVYLAAVMTIDSRQFATLNVNAIRTPAEVADAIPISYDDESLAEKITRRRKAWTPVAGFSS